MATKYLHCSNEIYNSNNYQDLKCQQRRTFQPKSYPCKRKRQQVYTTSNTYIFFQITNSLHTLPHRITKTAQMILDVRAKYNATLADLYNPTSMPHDLLEAHRANDRAVMEAYGFNWHCMKESQCVEELLRLYEKLT